MQAWSLQPSVWDLCAAFENPFQCRHNHCDPACGIYVLPLRILFNTDMITATQYVGFACALWESFSIKTCSLQPSMWDLPALSVNPFQYRHIHCNLSCEICVHHLTTCVICLRSLRIPFHTDNVHCNPTCGICVCTLRSLSNTYVHWGQAWGGFACAFEESFPIPACSLNPEYRICLHR